jgi:hypothetical protein
VGFVIVCFVNNNNVCFFCLSVSRVTLNGFSNASIKRTFRNAMID